MVGLSLNSIDSYESILDIMPAPITTLVGVSCVVEIELLRKLFEDAGNEKLRLLKKLREINPASSCLADPTVKSTVWG